MLPKRFRLSNEEFKAVKKTGKLASGRLMGILIQETTDYGLQTPAPKAGLIVSKKLSNKAVIRNTLKRRIRAALQRILPILSPTLHVVALPNKRAIGAEVRELEEELRSILMSFRA